ncbi:uncharacterized protein MONBRDRAFT_27284 [Monosiga brevicollis MX1]|uniref:Uncharacterized protein n=1 Tax=Monosiga brevicollis TaxID=81824 RepID=A9V4U9_MONBE|nr:uncharacterized protein MONBRDRAFT_27284 [Monosiga brevicollis MX1]EDQ87432.1 predicted protein [Monosiga brevicollis MX1]|eukprot:XP_001747692.1 hypothetical protein [Monosiga brevicollis MX1]
MDPSLKDQPLKEILKDPAYARFKPLEKIIGDLNVRDWASQTLPSLLDCTPDDLKMHVSAFYRVLEREGKFLDALQGDTRMLDLSMGMVTSVGFGLQNSLKHVLENLRLDALDGISVINLSYNNLLDQDGGLLLRLADRMAERKPPQPKVEFRLTGNRFTPNFLVETALPLCQMDHISYVVVPDLGRSDATAALAHMHDKSALVFNKLIFIREMHLPGGHWQEILPPGVVPHVVRETHDKYYLQARA